MSIQPTTFDDIKGFANDALKKRVKVIDRPHQRWWTILADGLVVGCIALAITSTR